MKPVSLAEDTVARKAVTIRDVARHAGVSVATASRALNGKDVVNAQTRERILSVMEELGFAPSPAARRLSLGRTLTIGVLVSFLTRPQATERLRGVDAVLTDSEFDLVIYNVEPGAFESTLAEVFEQIGRPAERRGNVWVAGVPVCELEPFAGGQTVTLRWVADDPQFFQEVERHLRAAVGGIPSPDSQAGRWLMSAAVGSAVIAIVCTALLLYALALIR